MSKKLRSELDALKERIDGPTAKKLNIQLLKRIILRIETFSTECKDCTGYITELENHLKTLEPHKVKDHNGKINKIKTHLQKEHNLLPEGYYLSMYMSLGVSFGLMLGLLFSRNIALGLPLGMSAGVAIGAGMDADAKKKGKTI